jgi:hypothetical protein
MARMPAKLIRWELPQLIGQVRSVCEITPEGCWLWRHGIWKERAHVDQRPYPRIVVGGERHLVAHWVLVASGQPRPDGMEPCHSCDRPPCCALEHLHWDTHQANMAEMGARGRAMAQRYPELLPRGDDHWGRRHPERIPRGPRPGSYAHGDDHWTRRMPEQLSWRGTAHHMARLNADTVRAIRADAAAGVNPREIAAALGVGRTTVRAVIEGRTWKHVT